MYSLSRNYFRGYSTFIFSDWSKKHRSTEQGYLDDCPNCLHRKTYNDHGDIMKEKSHLFCYFLDYSKFDDYIGSVNLIKPAGISADMIATVVMVNVNLRIQDTM